MRVAREVGTEGKLGGQANVPGVASTWKDLTDNVNFMASNLTAQTRAAVFPACARIGLLKRLKDDLLFFVAFRQSGQARQEAAALRIAVKFFGAGFFIASS